MTDRNKNRLLTFVGIIVSVLFLWIALWDTNISEVTSVMAHSNLWPVLPFLVVYGLYYWLKSVRWSTLLPSTENARASQLFPIIVIGYAGNTLLPLRMGELMRLFLAQRKLGEPYSVLIASIAIEHVFDFLIILAVISLTLILSTDLQVLKTAGWIVASLAVLVSALVIAYVLWTPKIMAILTRLTTFLPAGLQSKFLYHVGSGAPGMKSIARPAALSMILWTSVVQWICMFGCIYLSLAAIQIEASLPAVLSVLALTVIAIIIPTSPGDVGAVQLAYALALKPYGVSAAEAFAASIYFHVIANVSVVIGGFYFLHRAGYTFRQVRDDARSMEEELDA